MFADTNEQLVLIGSSGCNLQYKPFCDWLTLIKLVICPHSYISSYVRKLLHNSIVILGDLFNVVTLGDLFCNTLT